MRSTFTVARRTHAKYDDVICMKNLYDGNI